MVCFLSLYSVWSPSASWFPLVSLPVKDLPTREILYALSNDASNRYKKNTIRTASSRRFEWYVSYPSTIRGCWARCDFLWYLNSWRINLHAKFCTCSVMTHQIATTNILFEPPWRGGLNGMSHIPLRCLGLVNVTEHAMISLVSELVKDWPTREILHALSKDASNRYTKYTIWTASSRRFEWYVSYPSTMRGCRVRRDFPWYLNQWRINPRVKSCTRSATTHRIATQNIPFEPPWRGGGNGIFLMSLRCIATEHVLILMVLQTLKIQSTRKILHTLNYVWLMALFFLLLIPLNIYYT